MVSDLVRGNQLLRSGKLEEAVDAFQKAIAHHPHFHWSHYKLGEALEQLGRLEEARVAYQKATDLNPSLDKLAPELESVNSIENSDINSSNLGKKAIKAIFKLSDEQSTIKLEPNYVWMTFEVHGEQIYQLKGKISSDSLGYNLALFQLQLLDGDKNIIEGPYEGFPLSPSAGYFKYIPISSPTMSEFLINIKTLPNTCYIKGGFRTWRTTDAPVYLESQLEIVNCYELGGVYDQIWNLFNQSFINLDNNDSTQDTHYESENIDHQIIANTYFNETTKYQEVKLESMDSREMYPWLKSLEIENCVQFLENIHKCRQYQAKSNQYIHDFKLNAIKNGYLESVCPWSGEILKSNQSFLINNYSCWLFYRFIGHQVFYLIVGLYGGHKIGLYFPSVELIIYFINTGFTGVCNTFKSYVVSRWRDVINYLSDKNSKDLVGITGVMGHFGHTVLNEYSSYHELSEKNLLINFKKYMVAGAHEFIPFDKLFPEVNQDNLIRKPERNSCLQMFEYAIKNNYFIIRPTNGGYNLNRGLAKRICSASVKSSSETCLQEIEVAKKYFPVLWFEIKPRHRTWLNQAEGMAKIANRLYSDYPNLAIIFAGWSCLDSDNSSDNMWIEKDQQVVQESQGLIDPNIPTLAIVGHKIYEKIAWAGAADIHIVTYGSGLIFASIANKPSVIHANTGWYPVESIEKQMKAYHPGLVDMSVVPIENITEDQPEVHFHGRNYYCNWEGIYHEIVKLLNALNQKA
ncbi:tetratricopeptide repeat protein [Limnospira fusiformis]|uniref:tetratricopeptide repeat protein n=1 Tax=Limnospira fusiformis TaxID=54297 RepID=UPI001448D506|nr:tetratricopeptide repeat protein [Limnospira fusiformis SAG 85.79]